MTAADCLFLNGRQNANLIISIIFRFNY